jgi:hypothetical protein
MRAAALPVSLKDQDKEHNDEDHGKQSSDADIHGPPFDRLSSPSPRAAKPTPLAPTIRLGGQSGKCARAGDGPALASSAVQGFRVRKLPIQPSSGAWAKRRERSSPGTRRKGPEPPTGSRSSLRRLAARKQVPNLPKLSQDASVAAASIDRLVSLGRTTRNLFRSTRCRSGAICLRESDHFPSPRVRSERRSARSRRPVGKRGHTPRCGHVSQGEDRRS